VVYGDSIAWVRGQQRRAGPEAEGPVGCAGPAGYPDRWCLVGRGHWYLPRGRPTA